MAREDVLVVDEGDAAARGGHRAVAPVGDFSQKTLFVMSVVH